MLFNPWCAGKQYLNVSSDNNTIITNNLEIHQFLDDLVYMPDQRLLDEYILNDVGKIWVGPIGSSRGREWVFGQFDAYTLPAAMLMFERSELPAVRLETLIF